MELTLYLFFLTKNIIFDIPSYFAEFFGNFKVFWFTVRFRGKTVRPWDGIPNCESHSQAVRVGRSDLYNPLLWSRGGALENFVWHGGRALPTLRPPFSFWILGASLSKHNLRWRIFLETQQIRRLAYLPRMGKTFRGFQGMFSWFYFFISSLFIKPEVMIRSYRTWIYAFFLVMKWNFCWSGIWIKLI